MGEQVLEVGDRRQHFLVLVLDLLPLESGQPPQLHVEDRLGLKVAQLEAAHQAFLGLVGVLGFADRLDHRVEVGQRDQQPVEDVGPRPAPAPVRTSSGG